MIKVLNLYAGIGGNRKLWKDVEVTAIENNKEIAKIYQDFFPNDKVIVTDAHQYLLEHYKEFDFIWSSPPCPTHSRMNFLLHEKENFKDRYPNMNLYQEILFLKHFCKTKWVVENVISYYKPLIKPLELHRHYFWSNFIISKDRFKKIIIRNNKGIATLKSKCERRGIDYKKIEVKSIDKRQVLNNMVDYKLGLHIFNCAFKTIQRRL